MRRTTPTVPANHDASPAWERDKKQAEVYIGKTIVAVEFADEVWDDRLGACVVLVFNDGSKMFVNKPWGQRTFDGSDT